MFLFAKLLTHWRRSRSRSCRFECIPATTVVLGILCKSGASPDTGSRQAPYTFEDSRLPHGFWAAERIFGRSELSLYTSRCGDSEGGSSNLVDKNSFCLRLALTEMRYWAIFYTTCSGFTRDNDICAGISGVIFATLLVNYRICLKRHHICS
jgi:hypothetical protein